jgi:hypothetical protein
MKGVDKMARSKGIKATNRPISCCSDRDWMAKDDARTMIQAKAIQADKSRFNAAVKAAKSMSEEKAAEAKAAASIAKAKTK